MRNLIKYIVPFLFVIPVAVIAERPPFVWGQAWPVGAKAFAMGGAFTAVADDYTALHYNPAGLGQIKSAQVGGSFSYLSVSNEANYLGQNATEESDYTKLHALGFVMPVPTVRGSLVFGISYHRVQQFDEAFLVSGSIEEVNYQATWQQSRYEQGGLSNTSLGGAVELSPGLYVGGAINFWGGDDDYTWQFAELDPVYSGVAVSDSSSTDHILTEFSGVNFTFSTLCRMNDHVRLGVAIQTPITLKAKEKWDYSEVFTWDDGYSETNYSEDGRYEYRVQFPWLIRGGMSVSYGPVLVSGDVALKNYSEMRYKSTPPSGGSMGESNLDIKHNFDNVVDYGIGCQIQIPNAPVSILGGYAKANAPDKDKLAKEDREIYSGGVNIRVNPKASLRIAYARTSYETTIHDSATDLYIDQKIKMGKALFSILYFF